MVYQITKYHENVHTEQLVLGMCALNNCEHLHRRKSGDLHDVMLQRFSLSDGLTGD